MKFVAALFLLMAVIHSSYSAGIRSTNKAAEKKVMVCYYGSWAAHRPGPGRFEVEDIDPFICTHVIYAFATLGSDSTIQSADPSNDLEENGGKGAYKRFVGLKEKNPALKALISIGGWQDGSQKYSQMAADPQQRAIFVKSVVDFLQLHKFDGLDFDWEFPAVVDLGGQPQDKANFVQVLTELKAAFQPHNFMLTAALSSGKETIDNAYDIPALANVLDHFHLMGYDYHGNWEPFTGHNSPLYTNPLIDTGKYVFYSQDFSVKYFIQNGAPPSKLVLGMATYGRGFILDDVNNNGLYASASQPIPPGPITNTPGYWGYNEICSKLMNENDWTVALDVVFYKAPYAFNSQGLWIGYDDTKSLETKAQYAVTNQLLGAMVWSLETDDFRGDCSLGEKFPLIKTIVNTLNG